MSIWYREAHFSHAEVNPILKSVRSHAFRIKAKSVPAADESLPKLSCAVNEVTIMNLQPDKKATLIQTVDKTGKGLRSSSFRHSAPNLSEMAKEEVTIQAEKRIKEGPPSPRAFYATEAQSVENLVLKRVVRLAPLEIPLEVKEAQLQKMMSLQREAQLAAFKLASVGSIGSEPHLNRVKDLTEGEVENHRKIKMAERTAFEQQSRICSTKVSKPSCEVQIVLPTEGNLKAPQKCTAKDSSMPLQKPVILQDHQEPDVQESPKIAGNLSQGNGRHRFRLKQMKEQECLSKTKPLKAMGYGVEEGKQKELAQRTQKTLKDASKLLENIARKHKGREDEPDEIDKELLEKIQSSRRMALGDITQVDED